MFHGTYPVYKALNNFGTHPGEAPNLLDLPSHTPFQDQSHFWKTSRETYANETGGWIPLLW